ncbi:Zinc carboxypeptidase [Popillia japonica]
MRNVPNTYILSLSLADLLLILTCVPFTSIIYTLESWPWGVIMCKTSEIVKDISTGVSVFTLTALSAERYSAIVNPLRKLQTKPLTVLNALLIWLVAVLLSIPDGVFTNVMQVDSPNNFTTFILICTPFPNITTTSTYVKYNVAGKALIFYVVPLSIIATFYILMAKKLHDSAKEMPGEMQGQSMAQVKARRHVARMVLCFVFLKVRSGHRVVTVRRVKCSSLKFHRVPYGNEKLVSGCCRKLARADCSFVANNVPKLRVTLNLVHFVDIDDKVTTLINCQLQFSLLYNRMWRKTRTPYGSCYGADPNRNWGYRWNTGGASSNPCSDTFAGPNPFSERSTSTMSQFFTGISSRVVGYISFHSYSQLLLFPYGHTTQNLDNYAELKEVGDKAATALASRFGTRYTVGNIAATIYVATGGSMDWAKGVYGTRITYTYELRDLGRYGFILPADQIIPSGLETLDSFVTIFDEFAAKL